MKLFGHEIRARRSEPSLKVRTWRFFFLLLSIFCVIMVVSYSVITTRAVLDNELKSSELAMTSINKNIKTSLERYKEMSRLIMLNSEVVQFLRNTGKGHAYTATQVRAGIFSVTNIYSNVDSVYVYRQDGESVRIGGGVMRVDERMIRTQEWNNPLQAAKGGPVIMINGGGAFRKDSGSPLITIARHIYNIDSQEVWGLLVVNLSASVLDTANKDFSGANRPVCYFDRDGNALWGNAGLKGLFRQEFVDGGFIWKEITGGVRRQILTAYSSADIPIIQISLGDIPPTMLQSRETAWIAAILIAAFVLALISSGAFISINVTRPIEQLTRSITNTHSNGMLQKTNLALPDNEIRRLADTYNVMVDHINRLITELIEKEKSVQKAEMRVLHEQIKPHFLYNSIETISYMALMSDAPKVHDALETLGSFYRNFLSKGSREVPLRNEMMIVRDYLALQKLRYGDIFDDEYDVDEALMDTMIPKLILQPLVENSLNHGIRLKGEKGVIRVRAFESGDTVHISVYDSGVGMTPFKIAEALSGEADTSAVLSGFGLKGTIDRIRYYCDCHDVIEIRSEPGEYTEIEIIMPKRGEAVV